MSRAKETGEGSRAAKTTEAGASIVVMNPSEDSTSLLDELEGPIVPVDVDGEPQNFQGISTENVYFLKMCFGNLTLDKFLLVLNEQCFLKRTGETNLDC